MDTRGALQGNQTGADTLHPEPHEARNPHLEATTPAVEQPLTVAINWWTDPNLFLAALVTLLKVISYHKCVFKNFVSIEF